MRGFGIVVLLFGAFILIAGASMDVSVATGLGRVNNIGLMAKQQNLTIIGGLISLGGLLMVLLGGNIQGSVGDSVQSNSRPCPLCAETIKCAAVKCKHCGSDVAAVAPSSISHATYGWTLRVECDSLESVGEASRKFEDLGLPLVKPDGMIELWCFFRVK